MWLVTGCGRFSLGLEDTVWRTDCGASAPSKSSIQEISFTDSAMAYTRMYYDSVSGKQGCVDQDYRITYRFSSTLGDSLLDGFVPKLSYDQLQTLDASLTAIELTPVTEAFATDANTAVLCGKSDWAAGQTKSLLGLEGATLANCSDIDVGTYTGGNSVSALDMVRPFNFVKYDSTWTAVVITSGITVFSSVGVIHFNSEKDVLYFGTVSMTTYDGSSAAKRAILGGGAGTSSRFYKK